MRNKEHIYTELKSILIDLFEINESTITLDASLYEDLDLDSIDAIDLIVKLQQMTEKKVNPEDFKNARHVRDVVDIIHKLIQQ
jgi:acyl carrier protein